MSSQEAVKLVRTVKSAEVSAIRNVPDRRISSKAPRHISNTSDSRFGISHTSDLAADGVKAESCADLSVPQKYTKSPSIRKFFDKIPTPETILLRTELNTRDSTHRMKRIGVNALSFAFSKSDSSESDRLDHE